VTAAHCFPTGAAVYGEGGAQPGHWTYTPGNHFGNISAMRDGWDAELIDSFRYNGAGFNSDEADTPAGKWYPVNSYAYSYAGQTVCQDGARSYYNGRGVLCGIKVTNADLRYQLVWADNTVHNVRGVRGTAGYAGTDGDSGALVFAVTDSTHRQARGVHSAGTTASDIIWTEAPDILNAFNLKLNPHQ